MRDDVILHVQSTYGLGTFRGIQNNVVPETALPRAATLCVCSYDALRYSKEDANSANPTNASSYNSTLPSIVSPMSAVPLCMVSSHLV